MAINNRTFFFSFIKKGTILVLLLLLALFVFSRLSSPVTRNIDDYTYALPFKPGDKHRVVQGYGGLFSHKNIAALDFEMPEGTAVYAAREGEVYSYKDNSHEGGPLPKFKSKANYLMIKHRDGSIGCYWHLQQNGVLVKKGPVAKGQLIGYSGATGLVVRPHLHFSVKRKLNYDKDSFIRTRFETSRGIRLLENGELAEGPTGNSPGK